jgi:lysozyme
MKCSTIMRGELKGWETGPKLKRGEPALKAYRCPAGVWTIGWGATGKGITAKSVVTRDWCEKRFDADLMYFEHGVERLLKGHPATQGQFDALVSFAYNCGLDEDADTKAEGLGDSTLLRLHLAGDYAGAAAEFGKWTSGGMAGLVSRRAVEKRFYLS